MPSVSRGRRRLFGPCLKTILRHRGAECLHLAGKVPTLIRPTACTWRVRCRMPTAGSSLLRSGSESRQGGAPARAVGAACRPRSSITEWATSPTTIASPAAWRTAGCAIGARPTLAGWRLGQAARSWRWPTARSGSYSFAGPCKSSGRAWRHAAASVGWPSSWPSVERAVQPLISMNEGLLLGVKSPSSSMSWGFCERRESTFAARGRWDGAALGVFARCRSVWTAEAVEASFR